MSTNNFGKSDLFALNNIVQASMIMYPKEVIIATLRDLFAEDSFYHYTKDAWGFANTQDHTDLPPGADLPANSPGSSNSLPGIETLAKLNIELLFFKMTMAITPPSLTHPLVSPMVFGKAPLASTS